MIRPPPTVARAELLAGNDSKLEKTGPGLHEFQPRLGFAWDPTGSGKLVIRGGYGIARDQIFQNLTLWSIQQSVYIYQTIIDLRANNPGATCTTGALCSYVARESATGARPASPHSPKAHRTCQHPNLTDAWAAAKSSIGFAYQAPPVTMRSQIDYYHVLGTHEPRMIQDNRSRTSVRCGQLPNNRESFRSTVCERSRDSAA